MPLDDKTKVPAQNDILARALAVLLAALGIIYSSYNTQDRFTGAQGARMDERLKAVERQVASLPPEWLKRDLQRIDSRLGKIEEKLEEADHAH